MVDEVFQAFRNSSNEVRFSFDIANKEVGVKLLNTAKEIALLNQIEITDRRLRVLSHLRNENKKVKLIYTLTGDINIIKSADIPIPSCAAANQTTGFLIL